MAQLQANKFKKTSILDHKKRPGNKNMDLLTFNVPSLTNTKWLKHDLFVNRKRGTYKLLPIIKVTFPQKLTIPKFPFPKTSQNSRFPLKKTKVYLANRKETQYTLTKRHAPKNLQISSADLNTRKPDTCRCHNYLQMMFHEPRVHWLF
jgi:hypothetical protein